MRRLPGGGGLRQALKDEWSLSHQKGQIGTFSAGKLQDQFPFSWVVLPAWPPAADFPGEVPRRHMEVRQSRSQEELPGPGVRQASNHPLQQPWPLSCTFRL